MTDTNHSGGFRNDDERRAAGGDGQGGVPPIPPGPLAGAHHEGRPTTAPHVPVPPFQSPGQGPYPPRPESDPTGQGPYVGPDPSAGGPGVPFQGPYGGPGAYASGGGAPPQGPYVGPGAFYRNPSPRRGGMPVWGWVLIGAGVLVVGAIGILGALLAIGLAATTTADSTFQETAVSVPAPSGGGAADGQMIDAPLLQPLDVSASFLTPPVWGLPDDPWTLDGSPAEGTFVLLNTNSCDMLLEQAYMPPLEGDDDLSSDAAATRSYMTYLLEFLADLEGGTAEGTAGSVPVSINFAGGPTLDLATTTLPGVTLDGDDGVRFVATRAMPASTGVVSTIITCPQSVVAADPDYFEQAIAELYIIPAP